MEQKRNKVQSCDTSTIKNLDFKYKDSDLERLSMLEASLRKFGQLRPILVTLIDGVLFALEGRKVLFTATVLGWPEVDIILLQKEDAELLNIILNELQFESNYIDLSKQVEIIQGNRNLLPFTPIELEKLNSIAKFDWDKLNKIENPEQISLF